MNARMKIAASGLLIAALAASETPAFATGTSNAGKVAGHSRHIDGPGKHNRGPLAVLVTAGTITQLQADAVETATRTAMQTAQATKFNAALAALIANNTITQQLADGAKASAAANLGKHARPDLSTWTEAQRTALHTWLDANQVDRAAIGNAVIAKLVTAGTVTQAQADAINAVFAAAPAKGDGPGRGGRGAHHDGDRAGLGTGVTPAPTV